MSFHVKSKWVIGLTGPILSGKSTALSYFKQCGAETISCDAVAATLYTRPAVLKKIKARLGTNDRAELAQLVFKNAVKRKALEQILHPLILKEVQAQVKACAAPVVVIEAPLLFEAGWEKFTDLNIVLLADPKTLQARLKGRAMSHSEYERRLKTQLLPLEKAARADIVWVHTGKAQLKQRVQRFCTVFKVLHKK
ncbi:MAG: dephospho-CoA kinase [Elusimicrobiaceae bacterium]|nr:dephospho-CoA kinase [Elusimicrobiaceae bacterium]